MSKTKQNAKMIKVRYFVINAPFLVRYDHKEVYFQSLWSIRVYAIFMYVVHVVE